MALQPGTKLGPYEILASIGKGGMGEVYKARDTRLDRVVAIKVSQENFSERFEREARAVAALNHPHICTLHDVGPNYLVMEFVEGEPLRGPLQLEKAIDYAGQILEALDHAHSKGITHRDLKPANILVTKQGIKLLDFGLAKIKPAPLKETDDTLTRALTKPLTQGGQILGTVQYMAPEQLQGKEADSRSDLFAFGCLLYEMLTGKRAFEGTSAASIIAAILERPSPSVGDVAPAALDRVLRRSLEKDPDRRWQNALDLRAALEWSVVVEQPTAAGPADVSPRSRSGWIAAGVFAAAAAAMSFVHLREKAPEAPVVRFSIPAPEKLGYGLPTVSPDGKRVVFSASDAQGRSSLWLRDLNSETPRQIQGTEGAVYPFWSPDQRYIGFEAGRFIKKIAVDSGLVETIGEAASATQGAVWTADGSIIFGENLDGLYVVPAVGGAVKKFTSLDTARQETRHYWPSLTPDGKSVLFTVTSPIADVQGIWIAPIANPSARRRVTGDISSAAYSEGHLLFVRNENLVALPFDLDAGQATGEPVAVVNHVPFNPAAGFADFSVSRNGVIAIGAYEQPLKLVVFDRAGKALSTFGPEARRYQFITISPDQTHVASDAPGDKGYEIFVFDPARDAAVPLTNGTNTGNFPVWSPDGARIAFGSNRDGIYNIYIKSSSGSSQDEVLLRTPQNKFVMDWSRDGRYLLYGENPPELKNIEDLWILPMTGDHKRMPYVQDSFDKRDAKFSPDGRWVAYSSAEGQLRQVFVRSFPSSSSKLQVSVAAGDRPRWRDDGKELFFMDLSGRLMAVDIRADGDQLSASTPKALFDTGLTNTLMNFDVYKGGQRFVMSGRLEAKEQPISVILNWTGLVKK